VTPNPLQNFLFRGNQLDKLSEPHFRKQLKQGPSINIIKYLYLFYGSLFLFIQPQSVNSVSYEISFRNCSTAPFTVSLLCM